jgi:hypothetical protein
LRRAGQLAAAELKRHDKLLQLVLGQLSQIPLGQIGRAALEGHISFGSLTFLPFVENGPVLLNNISQWLLVGAQGFETWTR